MQVSSIQILSCLLGLCSFGADCGDVRLGVAEVNHGDGLIVTSTARKRWPMNAPEGQVEAIRDATIVAKGQLSRKLGREKLSGLVVTGSCVKGDFVYVSVESSQHSRSSSNNLRTVVEKSVKRAPTPR